MDTSLWSQWDSCHDLPDQKKRIDSSKKAELTPISLSIEECTGYFAGSRSKYRTTLVSCECIDFIRRKMPCKHMYRLATELGVFGSITDCKADKSKLRTAPNLIETYSLSKAVDILEKLTVNSQLLLKHILLDYYFHTHRQIGLKTSPILSELIDSNLVAIIDNVEEQLQVFDRSEINRKLISLGYTGFKKNMKKSSLIKWCIDNCQEHLEIICNDSVAVTVSPELVKRGKHLYTYLRHKFDYENVLTNKSIVYSLNFNQVIKCEFSALDDEITNLLNVYCPEIANRNAETLKMFLANGGNIY